MEYRCIKEMHLQKFDEDGFSTDEYGTVTVGSTWYEDKTADIIGGEVHLDCENEEDFGWIEITKADLKEFFEPVDDGEE